MVELRFISFIHSFKNYFLLIFSIAAAIKPLNKGCPLMGVDVNSG
jgi:hypothetical protein